MVVKALDKVSKNPLPEQRGGYGKPLGNHFEAKLHVFLKIKLKSSGLRIVYKIIETNDILLVIVIGFRKDNEVYNLAKRKINNNLLK